MTRRGIRPDWPTRVGLLWVASVLALGCPAADDTPARPGPTGMETSAARSDPSQPIAPTGPRIVSLSSRATRFLVALGAGPMIVALDGPTERAFADESRAPDARAPRLADLVRLDPDYVFLPALPDDQSDLAELEASGTRVIAFAPHNLEDVMALLHGVGTDLVGEEGATAFERRYLRPVALIAGQSSPYDRLRVLALVGVDPPEIAGGHSFETDLIEIAGASSLTHGGSDIRQPIDRENLAKRTPDLVVVMTDGEIAPADQDRALEFVGEIAPVLFFSYARETFWLEEPARDAARLRKSIVALERERASTHKP